MEKTKSPVFLLEREIASSAFTIAPEREEELAKLRDRHKIVLQTVDNDELVFGVRVDPITGLITLPTSALEYTWACAHLFWVIYQENLSAQRAGLTQLNVDGNARLQGALSLFNWARRNVLEKADSAWPADLPSPGTPREENEDATVANELFLAGLAWMIHHEIAHVALRHEPKEAVLSLSLSLEQERDADRTATRWILDGLERNDPKLLKRALGVATGILTLQSLEVVGLANNKRTHPPAHERLHSCLSNYEVGSDEKVQAFCVAALQVLFDHVGIATNIEGGSFQEILSDLLVDKSLLDRSKS
jgi:Peptidase U49